MAFTVGGSAVKHEINVTPLVDVVLVLLIIFMVVTPLLQRGKDVRLPKATAVEQAKKPDVLVISVLGDRTLWVETAEVTREALRDKLAEAIGKDPDRTILLKGDESLSVGEIRVVMAAAKGAGAKGLSLAVEEVHR